MKTKITWFRFRKEKEKRKKMLITSPIKDEKHTNSIQKKLINYAEHVNTSTTTLNKNHLIVESPSSLLSERSSSRKWSSKSSIWLTGVILIVVTNTIGSYMLKVHDTFLIPWRIIILLLFYSKKTSVYTKFGGKWKRSFIVQFFKKIS